MAAPAQGCTPPAAKFYAPSAQPPAIPAAGQALPGPASEAEDVWPRPWRWPGALIRQLFFLVFRAAPYPTAPRLLRLGNPDRRAPVLVTTNYTLTVRRVTRALAGTDCYLLVAPAGGMNVWCAAGDGRFSVDSIVSILKTSDIAALVDHRRLILPQLCANGIDMFEVKRRTGWTAVFGPARAEDVPEYLRRGRKKTEEMLRVTFTHRERLEMAIAMWGSLGLRYTLVPVLVLGWAAAPWFLLILAALSVAVSHGCFVLPGKTFVQKAGVAGLALAAAFLAAAAWTDAVTPARVLLWPGLTLGAAFLVGSAFPGYSPYWQCNYSTLFFGFPDVRLAVIDEGCIGCRICWEVCPVECFSATERHTYALVRPDLCEGCMACVIQCPTDTIVNTVAERGMAAACG
jgi:NAD-dependent dihydropyrimidine dehydrogenase PreA subunit